MGSTPGKGAEIPHALQPKTKTEEKPYRNKFDRNLKTAHVKKKFCLIKKWGCLSTLLLNCGTVVARGETEVQKRGV